MGRFVLISLSPKQDVATLPLYASKIASHCRREDKRYNKHVMELYSLIMQTKFKYRLCSSMLLPDRALLQGCTFLQIIILLSAVEAWRISLYQHVLKSSKMSLQFVHVGSRDTCQPKPIIILMDICLTKPVMLTFILFYDPEHLFTFVPCFVSLWLGYTGIIVSMSVGNERRRDNVTASLIGWAYIQKDPCYGSFYPYPTGLHDIFDLVPVMQPWRICVNAAQW